MRCAAFKDHGTFGHAFSDLGKLFLTDAVGCQIFLVGDKPPHHLAGRNGQRFLGVDDGMGHDDALLADDDARIGAASQK